MTDRALRKLKVLCVDDEPGILENLAELIAADGYEVLTARGADEAMEVIRREAGRLVLVISDFQMGKRNGFDLRQDMLAEHKAIPFVILSGHISREAALQGIHLKVSAFLEKPFRNAELLKMIGEEGRDRVAAIREEDELLAGFAGEATALAEEMETLILFLEEHPGDVDAINRIFACAHTIKGASGFFKPDTVHRFTHRFEDYLSTFKKHPDRLGPDSSGVLLRALDTIKGLISALERGEPDPAPPATLLAVFEEPTGSEPACSPPPGSAKVVAPGQPSPAAKSDEIRVGISLLNDFMEKSGEITVLRNMVNKVLHLVERESPGDLNVSMLGDLLSEMHKVISSMQEQLGDLRKVPMKQVFRPLHRTLRDLCATLKKPISLETRGEELRVDHLLAETLSKCLTHMLRNSADHGVESSEARVAAGKPPAGTIRLSCEELTEEIVVTIADDGRGIDPSRVRAKAIENGLVTAEVAAKMTDAEVRMLIFEPGFSTAEQVTDVSGRGVGTDMVRQTVRSVGGSIRLESEVGKGTCFEFRLPVPKSVVIINSLMVRVSGHIFAIPQEKVSRVLRIEESPGPEVVRKIGPSSFYQHDGKLVPIVELSGLFGLSVPDEKRSAETAGMVWVQSKLGDYCLRVDEILDTEEIFVKKLGKWFASLGGYLGATFLGDGRIGLILDPDGVAEKAHLRQHAAERASAAAEEACGAETQPLLLFGLGTRTRYAIERSAIFRLESLRGEDVTRTGGVPIIIYRDQTMPLISLRGLLEGKSGLAGGEFPGEGAIPAIVIEQGGRFVALAVESIGDFVERALDGPETVAFDEMTETCIVQDQAVTLVRLARCLPPSISRNPERSAA